MNPIWTQINCSTPHYKKNNNKRLFASERKQMLKLQKVLYQKSRKRLIIFHTQNRAGLEVYVTIPSIAVAGYVSFCVWLTACP